jgi:peptidyl-prolyl cis-trans isomerase SurA
MMKKIMFSVLLLSASVGFAEIVDRIVAVVNNEIVTLSDLRNFNKRIEKNGMIDDLLLFGQRADSLKGNQKAQLDYLINEKILDSEIKRLNLGVTIERVEQEIRDIAKKNGVSRNELMNAIKAQGMSASDYQAFIKTRIERQALIEQEITSKIRVSDEDVMAQYSRINPNNDAGIFEYNLAQILFNPNKGGPNAAHSRAENALKKIREGVAFETVAEQTSEDPNFSSGGSLGNMRAGEFNPELEKVARGMNAGEVSGIIQTKAGFHIIKVLSKKIIADPQFEKEKEKIRGQLFEKAFQKHFKNWLDGKREESFVRINQ